MSHFLEVDSWLFHSKWRTPPEIDAALHFKSLCSNYADFIVLLSWKKKAYRVHLSFMMKVACYGCMIVSLTLACDNLEVVPYPSVIRDVDSFRTLPKPRTSYITSFCFGFLLKKTPCKQNEEGSEMT